MTPALARSETASTDPPLAASPALFLPPAGAAHLYPGWVMHHRMKPVVHRFSYRVFNILIDIDRLAEASRLSPFFSVNGRNLVAFHEADHRGGGDGSLRSHVDAMLAEAGLPAPAARVLLACYPRILGRVFNPIAVYYAYDEAERLLALIYEVRNTFGERHTYVCRVEPGQVTAAGVRQERAKVFYVSPFLDMDMRYHFRMQPPGETIKWRILETDRDGPMLAATFSATRRTLSTANLASCVLRVPFQTWKIVGGIHFEAFRLWLKGARYRPRGRPPEPVSFADGTDGDARNEMGNAGRRPNRESTRRA